MVDRATLIQYSVEFIMGKERHTGGLSIDTGGGGILSMVYPVCDTQTLTKV